MSPRPELPGVNDTIDVSATRIDIQGSGPKHDYAGLLEYWQMVRRHKGATILAILAGGLIGFLGTLQSPRIYQSRTSLEIQGLNEEFLNIKNVNPVSDGNAYLDTDIQTQVKLLQSRALLAGVKKKLEPLQPAEGLQPPDRLGVWRKALKISPPDSDALWRKALGVAAGGVRVRASGTNRIVDVSCDSTHPQLAADFCNTLTQEFIDQSLQARWKTTEYTGQWLTKQLEDLKIKLEKQEEEMQAYARATSLVFTSDKGDSQQSLLAELEKELSVARADRISKQSKFEMAATMAPGALPDVLDDVSLKDTQKTLADLQSKLAQLKVTFTPNHAEVKKVQAQIVALEESLEGSRTNVLTRIRKEFEAAQRRETLLTDSYKTQARLISGKAEEVAHYGLLKRDVDATRLLYETLLQRLKEASIASALRANNIRIVDAGERPVVPYKPDVSQAIMLGLLFGTVVGVALSVVRERADRTLQDPGDLSYYLTLPELGVVPTADLTDVPRFKRPKQLRLGGNGSGDSAAKGSIEMISWGQRQSLVAESIRTTLTSILFARTNGARPRVLVLTSASPKEGKTTVVSNLAIALAQINQNVLLIDADLRRPRLHSVFDLKNGLGLSNLLIDKAPIDLDSLHSACTPTAVPSLFVMTSGTARTNASSLVHSPRLPEIIALARGRFDTVIIDTPPMINIADARIIARTGDALILVVRSGVTTRDAALIAKSRFAEDGTPILGTILNFWNPKTPGYSYYKYYYAGYYHYYGDGGRNGNGNGNGDSGGTSHEDDSLATDDQSEPTWKERLPLRPGLPDNQTARESES